jgi:adenylylsulfate kinase
MITRHQKASRLAQRARVVWLYGLSGAGKTTLATGLEERLFAAGLTTHVLDGDSLRTGLSQGLGFSDADRTENIRRAAEAARLLADAGVIVICAFITPRQDLRDLARRIIGPDDFLEVYVNASFATCARRDPKGLYAKASRGSLPRFTGRDSAFEAPVPSDRILCLDTEKQSIDASLTQLLAFVHPHVRPA